MAAVTLHVAACVVACILSCRVLVTPERIREGAGEGDGYLMGETEPFSIVSEAATVEDKEEEKSVPLDAGTASEGLTVDKLDIVLTEGGEVGAIEAASTDLNGNVELYIVTVDSGGVIEMADRSSMEPTCVAGEEALKESVAASALTEAGSVPVLMGEDMRLAEAGVGYCPC